MKKTSRFLEHRIKEKYKNGEYEKIFNKEIAEYIIKNYEKIAEKTVAEGGIDLVIEFELEETIREILLNEKNMKIPGEDDETIDEGEVRFCEDEKSDM